MGNHELMLFQGNTSYNIMDSLYQKKFVRNPNNFSIDRLDNDVTYQKGNIIFCHSRCNDTKHSVTIEMCERILKLYKMKKQTERKEYE